MNKILLPTSAILAVMTFIAFLSAPVILFTSASHEWQSILLTVSVTCLGVFLVSIPEKTGVPGVKPLGILISGIGTLMLVLSIAALFSG